MSMTTVMTKVGFQYIYIYILYQTTTHSTQDEDGNDATNGDRHAAKF